MNTKLLLNMKSIIMTLMVMTAMPCSIAFAQGSEATEPESPLELRKIMRTMGDDMQVITGAISREDWKLVVKTAPKIADHPQPSLIEKMRILAFAGRNVSEFKAYDDKTHTSARKLGEVAGQNDGVAVIDEFAVLQKTCLSCHQKFRKEFQKYFYNTDG